MQPQQQWTRGLWQTPEPHLPVDHWARVPWNPAPPAKIHIKNSPALPNQLPPFLFSSLQAPLAQQIAIRSSQTERASNRSFTHLKPALGESPRTTRLFFSLLAGRKKAGSRKRAAIEAQRLISADQSPARSRRPAHRAIGPSPFFSRQQCIPLPGLADHMDEDMSPRCWLSGGVGVCCLRWG